VCAPRCIFRSDLAVAASFSFPGLVCVARAPSEPLVLTLPGISRSGSARSQFSHQAPPGFYSRLFYVRARDPISCSLFLVRATRLFFGLLLPFCLSAHFSCLLVRSVLQSGRRVFVVNVSSVLSCFGLPFCVASSSLFSSQQQSESFSVQGAHLFNAHRHPTCSQTCTQSSHMLYTIVRSTRSNSNQRSQPENPN
jgi:hypothetical protein